MKRFAICLAMFVAFTQIQTFADSGYNKKPAQKTPAKGSTAVRTNNNQAYPTSGSDFLLKYNVDDLEAAPWINGGKRIYHTDKK